VQVTDKCLDIIKDSYSSSSIIRGGFDHPHILPAKIRPIEPIFLLVIILLPGLYIVSDLKIQIELWAGLPCFLSCF